MDFKNSQPYRFRFTFLSFPIHNPVVSDSQSCCFRFTSCCFRFTFLLFPIHIPVVSDSHSCCFRFTILLFPIHNPIVSDWQSCSFRFTNPFFPIHNPVLSYSLFYCFRFTILSFWWRCPSVSILILIIFYCGFSRHYLPHCYSDKGIKGNFVNRTSHSLRWEVTKSTSTVPLQPDILYFS